MQAPTSADTLKTLLDEERFLLSCYRKMRVGQQMVLVELAALMSETHIASSPSARSDSSQ